jgi:acetolactate synthase I/III small subunit
MFSVWCLAFSSSPKTLGQGAFALVSGVRSNAKHQPSNAKRQTQTLPTKALTPPERARRLRALFMRHTISVLVENKFGVLTRIAGMFSGRGFNIDTLNVAPSLDASTSRMTIVVRGDDTVLEQVTKQLNKLVDVIKIEDFRDDEVVERELVMMRVKVSAQGRAEVMQMCDIFRAKIIDVQHNNLAIEITGNESKVEKFLMLMDKFGITELTRTGRVALARKSS